MRLLTRHPYTITGICFFCFMLSFAFFIELLSARVVTLMGLMGVGALVLESMVKGGAVGFVTRLGPLVSWALFVVLSYMVLPLIPYAGSRAWNNLTGMIFAFCVFMITRRYKRVPVMENFFVVYVLVVLIFYVLFPGLIGADTSQSRLGLSRGGGTLAGGITRMMWPESWGFRR